MVSTEIFLQYANDIENIPGKFLENYTCILCSIGNNEGSGIKHQIFNIYRDK